METVRDAFHTKKAPRLVMQKMLIGLNARVMQYLGKFEVDFAAYINDQFQIICRFPGGKEIPARLLSGGQSVALAVALRFSMSDLLAGNLPLIVMDEPTVFLDEANVTRLSHVLDKVKVLAKRGRFIQVITHEPGIMASFTRTEEV
jgi:exonuclease SbcC